MPKKKKEKAAKEEGGETQSLEYYEIKLADLTEKLERLKLKNDTLVKENTTLAKAQAKFYSDKQDIVEFLNIKVTEHEKMISNLETKLKTLDQEKKDQEIRMKKEYDDMEQSLQKQIEQMSIESFKLKQELSELSTFQSLKVEMEEQARHLRHLLEKKEKEYSETIHTLERKILQDKSQMKREMLQKVNEAVANFRRVADQQMEETTKRAIRENLIISTQLKKMSSKTVELVEENEDLQAQVEKLKKYVVVLQESEKQLAKRNHSLQKTTRMLTHKLKESDQMWDVALDEPKEPQQQEVLTEEMIQEMQSLQDDYNLLIDRIGETNKIASSIQLVLQEAKVASTKNKEETVLDYIQSNLPSLVLRLCDLTNVDDDFKVQSRDEEDGYKESQFQELQSPPEFDLLEEASSSVSSKSVSTKSLELVEEKPKPTVKLDIFRKKSIEEKSRDAGVQTITSIARLNPQLVSLNHRFERETNDVSDRPWGQKAKHVPQKGILYFPRVSPLEENQKLLKPLRS